MSLGIFRVVPLIKIFIFIQNVISMKLQKESHPSILAMKMQNKQLKVYVFYLSQVNDGLIVHEVIIILQVRLTAQEK